MESKSDQNESYNSNQFKIYHSCPTKDNSSVEYSKSTSVSKTASLSKPLGELLYKFSNVCIIAPYLTMNLEKVRYLMCILCSKTQTTFIKNEKAIMQVYRLQRWIGDQEIEGWLKDTNEEQAKLSIWYTEKYGPCCIDPKPKFDHNYRLNLDLDQRFISITKFMNRINKFKMRDIFRISISEISMLCQNKVYENYEAIKLFFYRELLDILDIDWYKVCRTVRQQVYLTSLTLSETILVQILEGSAFSETLILDDCEIVSLTKNFQLSSNIDYKTKYLSLINTLDSENKNKLNSTNIDYFIKAISECGLSKSLDKIHIQVAS